MYYSKAGTLGDDNTVVDSKAQQSVHCRDHFGNEPQLWTGILQYTRGKNQRTALSHSFTQHQGTRLDCQRQGQNRDQRQVSDFTHTNHVTEQGRQYMDGQNTQHVYHTHSQRTYLCKLNLTTLTITPMCKTNSYRFYCTNHNFLSSIYPLDIKSMNFIIEQQKNLNHIQKFLLSSFL